MPLIDSDLDGEGDRSRVLRWYKDKGDVIESGDTICDIEINFDPSILFQGGSQQVDDDGNKIGYGGSSVGETDSVVFGMDCEDEGIMGEKMVRSYEEGCTVEEYNDWRKSGTVICEVITYEEEEDWREKYGSVGEGEGK